MTTEAKSSTRKVQQAAEVEQFVRQYGRKARPGADPNDRGYDRRLEAKIKRMKPEELDALLRSEGDD